jgi:hypothetical protein
MTNRFPLANAERPAVGERRGGRRVSRATRWPHSRGLIGADSNRAQEAKLARTISILILLAALTLTSCYVYPPGWREGWHRGEYGGHPGWYDEGGHWQGEYSNGSWHR